MSAIYTLQSYTCVNIVYYVNIQLASTLRILWCLAPHLALVYKLSKAILANVISTANLVSIELTLKYITS